MQPPDTLPPSWQRLLALSGVAFAVLFVVGWFASGHDAPDYAAADREWTEWADDNQWKSRIGVRAMLLGIRPFPARGYSTRWAAAAAAVS
jgi:hypothetical protein